MEGGEAMTPTQETLKLVREMHAQLAVLQSESASARDRMKALEEALDKDRRAFASELAKLSHADGELRRELSAFMAQQSANNSGVKLEQLDKRVEQLELRNAKQDGGLQVAGWVWGAVGTTVLGFIGTLIYLVAAQ
jgi:uncharacterized coiled-coil protein SlyX